MIATITLNPSIDQNLIVRNLVKDDANRAEGVFRYPGGKGVNVSKVVRELGGRTCAYALIGGIPGELWRVLVTKLDIDHVIEKIKDNTRINTIITDLKDESQTRISAPGPEVSEQEISRFLNRLLAVRPKPLYWALGGSLSKGMRHETYRRFVLALQKGGVPCVLDTDNEALRFGVQAGPFMIKPNEYEMQRLTGRTLKTEGDYVRSAKSLVVQGIKIVVISLGSRGALFVTATESFHVSTPRVTVKSKVGAGDSLIGGFLFGLIKNFGIREAAKLGVAASTSSVMREAPRLCRRGDIAGLMRRIAIRKL